MKFPGKRKNEHYFPVTEKGRESADPNLLQAEPFYLVGIDQLLVDIECRVEPEFLLQHSLRKGESQILNEPDAEAIYRELKSKGKILGEYAGGSVGNTLNNYSVLSDERAVALGAITRNITVGDYAFKYIRNTSSKVDLSYLQPCENTMGRAMCFVTPDGERTFGISKGCMNDLTPEFIPGEVIEKASALLISAYTLRDEKDPSNIHKITPGTTADHYPVELDIKQAVRQARAARELPDLGFGEVLDEIANRRAAGVYPAAALMEAHQRVAGAVACVAFTLIGIPLGIKTSRRETSIGIALSLGLALIYYFTLVVANTLRGRPDCFPEVILWTPNLIFEFLGIWLLWRVSRV